jgi:hypothetical protein
VSDDPRDYIEVIPQWVFARDGNQWAFLCRRFADDRQEWKQRCRRQEAELAGLRAELAHVREQLRGAMLAWTPVE